ncbi:hypothetical protein AMK13_28660 [Streptomyces sp. CB02056]|nr:hypothetical protein AMK13_28660 [Streptomyces sp. CB02056]
MSTAGSRARPAGEAASQGPAARPATATEPTAPARAGSQRRARNTDCCGTRQESRTARSGGSSSSRAWLGRAESRWPATSTTTTDQQAPDTTVPSSGPTGKTRPSAEPIPQSRAATVARPTPTASASTARAGGARVRSPGRRLRRRRRSASTRASPAVQASRRPSISPAGR